MPTKSNDFDKLLINAIDEALLSLGESVEQSTYFHIQTKFKVQKNEIPKKLAEFQIGLEKIFGSGARYIEILIMKGLYAKIGKPIVIENDKEFGFVDYVNSARESFLKK